MEFQLIKILVRNGRNSEEKNCRNVVVEEDSGAVKNKAVPDFRFGVDRWTRFRSPVNVPSAANRSNKKRAGCIERRGYRNFIIGARPITAYQRKYSDNF